MIAHLYIFFQKKESSTQKLLRLVKRGELVVGALRILRTRARKDPQAADIIRNDIPSIISLLSSVIILIAENAASLLFILAEGNDNNRVEIVRNGGVQPLIGLLSSGVMSTKVIAANTLWELAINNDNKVAIAMEGGINPLVQLLSTGSEKRQKKTVQVH